MPLPTEVDHGRGHIVLDGDPALSSKTGGKALRLSAHVYHGQTARPIKIPLRMEIGLVPGRIVLHEDPAPLKGAQPPLFGPCLLWTISACIKMPLGTEVGVGPGNIVLDADPASPNKWHSTPTFRPMSIVAKPLDASRSHSVLTGLWSRS